MIDLGIDKLALIGAVALIVIGPEKLPRVARTVGVLLGKARGYVSQVQAEVNRSMDLEEMRKMKQEMESAAQSATDTFRRETSAIEQQFSGADNSLWHDQPAWTPAPAPRKNWRLKRGATPLWYKQKHGVRRHVQSGAARVARFRPPGLRR